VLHAEGAAMCSAVAPSFDFYRIEPSTKDPQLVLEQARPRGP
jgi:hypothetical protein